MTYTPQEISDALEFVEKYLDSIDTAVTIKGNDTHVATQISQGRTIIEEHSPNLEQIAEMGRYARTMIDGYLEGKNPEYYGNAPEELPTPDTPEQKQRYLEQATELYDALVSEKSVWELLPEDKRNTPRQEYLTTRIKELDEYFFARAVLDATFG